MLIASIVAAAVSGCSAMSHTGRAEVRESFQRTAAVGSIAAAPLTGIGVQTVAGRVTVTSAAVDSITIHAVVTANASTRSRAQEVANAIEIVSEPVGTELRVYERRPESWRASGSQNSDRWSVQYTITTPRDMRVEVESISSDVVITGTAGADIRTISGDVWASGVFEVTANTTSGAAQITAADACDVATVSGNIAVTRTRAIDAETISGRIDASDVSERSRFTTISGRTVVSLSGSGAPVRIASVSGNVKVNVPASWSSTVSVVTDNGRIRAGDMPIAAKERTHATLFGTIGIGGSDLHITSASGNVTLKAH
jgi:DUF4097 and DUF4098 domain-containing protein YvlB